MAKSEQRRHPRIRRRIPVLIGVRGRTFAAVTDDLSPTGLLIKCPEILQPGMAVSGILNLEGEEVGFGAMVRWSRSASRTGSNETQHSMGLSFLSAPGAAYLAYFEKVRAEQASPTDAKPTSGPVRPVSRPMARPAAPTVPPPAPKPAPPTVAPMPAPKPAPPTVAPMPPPVIIEPAIRSTPAPVLTGLVPGLVGRVENQSKPTDPNLRGTLPFAPSAAAVLFERAALAAVAEVLPKGTQTLGLSLKINLNRPPNIMLGAKLEAVATLLSISADRTLRFQVELREGERLVASGEHQRILVQS